MDERLILEFYSTEAALGFMQSLDALVDETGYSQWDTVKTSPIATYWIFSPSGDSRFPNWKDHIPTGYVEKVLPIEWQKSEEE